MGMVFGLQATAKDFVEDKFTTMEREAEEQKRKEEELANLAEVVRCRVTHLCNQTPFCLFRELTSTGKANCWNHCNCRVVRTMAA